MHLYVGILGPDIVPKQGGRDNHAPAHFIGHGQDRVSGRVREVLLGEHRRGKGQQRGDPPRFGASQLLVDLLSGVVVVCDDQPPTVPQNLGGTIEVTHRDGIPKFILDLIQALID